MLALAADRLAADPRGTAVRGVTLDSLGDADSFAAPLGVDYTIPDFVDNLRIDPLEGRSASASTPAIASSRGNPTVSTPTAGRRLTAVLVADDRPVAVIDDEVVEVGGRLKDGARISAIRGDRVWVVEKDGKWRVLTLAAGRP
jgi:hypothetical protein